MEFITPYMVVMMVIVSLLNFIVLLMIAPFVIKVKDVTVYTEKKVAENAEALHCLAEENHYESINLVRIIMRHFSINGTSSETDNVLDKEGDV